MALDTGLVHLQPSLSWSPRGWGNSAPPRACLARPGMLLVVVGQAAGAAVVAATLLPRAGAVAGCCLSRNRRTARL